jgi:stage II sporulation protein D
MPHAPQPDAKTRAFVPVLSLGLTALLCCAETAVVVPVTAGTGLERRRTRPPVAPEQAPLPSDTTTDPVIPTPVVAEPKPALPQAVRVRLDRVRGKRLAFGISGDYRIFAGALDDPAFGGGGSIATGQNLGAAQAEARNSNVRVNGVDFARDEVTIVPTNVDSLRVGGRRYAGALILRANGDELTAINLVDLEEYVYGVLYAEMPERFANEALRAQAVVSRSFALFHAAQGRELRDDQGSQVYTGLDKVDASARRIVDSTFGEVLTFNGIPIETYFHSTCGGRTSSARDVFGIQAPPPLCNAVICGGCADSPNFSWSRKVARADLDKLYRGALGSNLRFTAAELDAASRAVRVELLNSDGKVVDRVVADRFRNDFNEGRPLAKQLLSTRWTEILVDKKFLDVRGRGFGHGVGLCQYGSGGLARQGLSYRAILSRYFPGADLQRLYDE